MVKVAFHTFRSAGDHRLNWYLLNDHQRMNLILFEKLPRVFRCRRIRKWMKSTPERILEIKALVFFVVVFAFVVLNYEIIILLMVVSEWYRNHGWVMWHIGFDDRLNKINVILVLVMVEFGEKRIRVATLGVWDYVAEKFMPHWLNHAGRDHTGRNRTGRNQSDRNRIGRNHTDQTHTDQSRTDLSHSAPHRPIPIQSSHGPQISSAESNQTSITKTSLKIISSMIEWFLKNDHSEWLTKCAVNFKWYARAFTSHRMQSNSE